MTTLLVLNLILGVVNTLFLIAIASALSKVLFKNQKAPNRARKESGLVGLQDDNPNSPLWGPHVSYRDIALQGPGPFHDGLSPRKPNHDGISIRDNE